MRCYSGFLFLGTLKLLPRGDGGWQWLTEFGESNSLPFLLPWSVTRPMPAVRHSWLHSIAPFFVSQESLLATLSFAVCGMGRHSHALGMPLSVPSGMGNALTKVNVLAWMLCVGEANTVWKSSYIDQTQYFQNPLSTELPARGIRLWVPRPLLELQLWVPQAVTPHSRESAAEGGPAVEFGLDAIILQLSQVWGLFPITQGSLTSVPTSTSDLQNDFLSPGQRQIDSRLNL